MPTSVCIITDKRSIEEGFYVDARIKSYSLAGYDWLECGYWASCEYVLWISMTAPDALWNKTGKFTNFNQATFKALMTDHARTDKVAIFIVVD